MATTNTCGAPMAVAGLILTVATALASAQSAQPAQPAGPPPGKIDKPLVLIGCVAAEPNTPNQYTLSDPKAGVSYRLYGVKVYAYEGRRVRVVGGLYPTPNIAAQAGSIDPTKAAIASTAPTVIAGSAQNFQVTEIRPIKGRCPPRP